MGMNIFFEMVGGFCVGEVVSQQMESYQVVLESGERVKVKQKEVLFNFESTTIKGLLEEASVISAQLDLDFLWEATGVEEFDFLTLAREYFGPTVSVVQKIGLLIGLHQAPIYFYKKGKGCYKPAPKQALDAAKISIEKKRVLALVQKEYEAQLLAHKLPIEFLGSVPQLLFKPNKNSIEYKAIENVSQLLSVTPARLMLLCGGLSSAQFLHQEKFFLEHDSFRVKITSLPSMGVNDLPLANRDAFSIDDASTTEIDDAFSVQEEENYIEVGIHIAVPALGIKPGDEVDQIARKRLSTVYFPGNKMTMLPEEYIGVFSLQAGKVCPVLSLYVQLEKETGVILSTHTKVEALSIKANLRLSDLEDCVTEESLCAEEASYPYHAQLAILWKWAGVLAKVRADRRVVFGLRAEEAVYADFIFAVNEAQVEITPRKRGAPLDKIVSELMIFTNSVWAQYLDQHGVAAIHRVQGREATNTWISKLPVRMTTKAGVHCGLGVLNYAWCTSPLRRYVDLVNQWQLLACVEHGVMAPLASPFSAKSDTIASIIVDFETKYRAYREFQNTMERYWCLRWLKQKEKRFVETVYVKEDIFNLVSIPLSVKVKVPKSLFLEQKSKVLLKLGVLDEVALSVEAHLEEVMSESLDVESVSGCVE
jgi:exoribonuclease-2